HVAGSLGGLQFQAELFLQCGEDRRSERRIIRILICAIFQPEGEKPLSLGSINDRPVNQQPKPLRKLVETQSVRLPGLVRSISQPLSPAGRLRTGSWPIHGFAQIKQSATSIIYAPHSVTTSSD